MPRAPFFPTTPLRIGAKAINPPFHFVSRTQIAATYSTDYKTSYTWDYRNRLTDVENYDNNPGAPGLKQHVHYVYDVFDHLIATEVDPTGGGTYTKISHYVLDVSPEIPAAGVPGTATAQPALSFDGNGNLVGRNLVALDPAGVDAVMIEGTVTSTSQADVDQYNLFDHLGSLRDIVNNASATLDRIVYSSVGQVAYESSPTTAHFAGFAGGHTDPYTDLVNDYHRWYDPATGKWLSNDPAGFAAGDADLSRYTANNTTNLIDPTGEKFVGPSLPSPSDPGAVNGLLAEQKAKLAQIAAQIVYFEHMQLVAQQLQMDLTLALADQKINGERYAQAMEQLQKKLDVYEAKLEGLYNNHAAKAASAGYNDADAQELLETQKGEAGAKLEQWIFDQEMKQILDQAQQKAKQQIPKPPAPGPGKKRGPAGGYLS